MYILVAIVFSVVSCLLTFTSYSMKSLFVLNKMDTAIQLLFSLSYSNALILLFFINIMLVIVITAYLSRRHIRLLKNLHQLEAFEFVLHLLVLYPFVQAATLLFFLIINTHRVDGQNMMLLFVAHPLASIYYLFYGCLFQFQKMEHSN